MAANNGRAATTMIADCSGRVAFDLALRITVDSRLRPEQRDEKYWLALYRKSHQATHGAGD
jgi:hypothetical protein